LRRLELQRTPVKLFGELGQTQGFALMAIREFVGRADRQKELNAEFQRPCSIPIDAYLSNGALSPTPGPTLSDRIPRNEIAEE
jgi:hypothetical protein